MNLATVHRTDGYDAFHDYLIGAVQRDSDEDVLPTRISRAESNRRFVSVTSIRRFLPGYRVRGAFRLEMEADGLTFGDRRKQ